MKSIDRLYAEEIGALVISPDGRVDENLPSHPLILSGSFNPLHDGHRAMIEAASQVVDRPAFCEISIENVDKPVLPRPELDRRAAQITASGNSLIVTSAPRFTEKSSLVPGATFVIGFDTYIRLMDDRYYPDHVTEGVSAVENSLDLIHENGCRFVVAGRVDDHSQFRGLHDIEFEVPQRFRSMFTELSESEFRSDLSSTQIRNSLN
jgi:glycerol-3-phosphate cytidylyltransferase-like family protein